MLKIFTEDIRIITWTKNTSLSLSFIMKDFAQSLKLDEEFLYFHFFLFLVGYKYL